MGIGRGREGRRREGMGIWFKPLNASSLCAQSVRQRDTRLVELETALEELKATHTEQQREHENRYNALRDALNSKVGRGSENTHTRTHTQHTLSHLLTSVPWQQLTSNTLAFSLNITRCCLTTRQTRHTTASTCQPRPMLARLPAAKTYLTRLEGLSRSLWLVCPISTHTLRSERA